MKAKCFYKDGYVLGESNYTSVIRFNLTEEKSSLKCASSYVTFRKSDIELITNNLTTNDTGFYSKGEIKQELTEIEELQIEQFKKTIGGKYGFSFLLIVIKDNYFFFRLRIKIGLQPN